MTLHTSGSRYAQGALESECAEVARTASERNERLNLAGFNMGRYVGAGALTEDEVERRLFDAATANGYVAKDGPLAARNTIRSGLSKGILQPKELLAEHHGSQSYPRPTSTCSSAPAMPHAFPAWTEPDPKTKRPLFSALGADEPEIVRDEVRRHVYRRGGVPMRAKVKREDGRYLDLYRVRRPADGAIGWQAKRPKGYVPVAYTGPAGALDPFDAEHRDEPLFWPEGEKDVDALQRLGCLAFTFGGASDVPDGCTAVVAGRRLVVLGDNDEPGEACVRRKVEAVTGSAARIEVVRFPFLPEGGDVSDWIVAEGAAATSDALLMLAQPAITGESSSADALLLGFAFDGDVAPDPPRYLVKGLLPAEGVAVLGGQSGAGKTFTGVDLAVSLATGEPFFGRRVTERVGTLILAAEGAGTLARRIAAARMNRCGSARLPIAWLGAVPNLADPEEVAALLPKIRAVDQRFRDEFGVRLGVIEIDTLAAAFAMKDENDAAEAQQHVRHMRMLGEPIGALVVPIHHYGKTAETGLRGSSAYRGGADVVLSVLAERNDATGDVGTRSLNAAKVRDGEEGAIALFTLRFVQLGTDEDGDPFGACIVEPVLDQSPPSARRREQKESLPIVALREAFDEVMTTHGRDVRVRGEADGAVIRAITIEELRPEFRRRYATVEVEDEKVAAKVRQALKRALDACPKHGFRTAAWAGEEWLWRA